MRIRCFPLPTDCQPPIGPNAVVIDVLRASTTICMALSNGASLIQPFPEVGLAKEFAEKGSGILTGGERQGEKLPGFDFGNSPLEYTADRVAGRTIAFTTTNGTRAMEKCRSASQVIVGAFCNLSAVVDFFRTAESIDLICAGTDGQRAIEDCAFAGAIVDRLSKNLEADQDESTEFCLQCWRGFRADPVGFFRSGQGGQNLVRLGRDEDIEFAARLDTVSIVPRLKIDTWQVEPA